MKMVDVSLLFEEHTTKWTKNPKMPKAVGNQTHILV